MKQSHKRRLNDLRRQTAAVPTIHVSVVDPVTGMVTIGDGKNMTYEEYKRNFIREGDDVIYITVKYDMDLSGGNYA